jgi:hypothetical protein
MRTGKFGATQAATLRDNCRQLLQYRLYFKTCFLILDELDWWKFFGLGRPDYRRIFFTTLVRTDRWDGSWGWCDVVANPLESLPKVLNRRGESNETGEKNLVLWTLGEVNDTHRWVTALGRKSGCTSWNIFLQSFWDIPIGKAKKWRHLRC